MWVPDMGFFAWRTARNTSRTARYTKRIARNTDPNYEPIDVAELNRRRKLNTSARKLAKQCRKDGTLHD